MVHGVYHAVLPSLVLVKIFTAQVLWARRPLALLPTSTCLLLSLLLTEEREMNTPRT